MAKNRKNQTAAIRFAPVLKVVLLCSLICGSAIGYVWQKGQIDRLGKLQLEREKSLDKIKRDNESLARQISILHSTVMLDRRAQELQLGLLPATPMQVVRLTNAAPPAPPNNLSRQFTQRSMNRGTP